MLPTRPTTGLSGTATKPSTATSSSRLGAFARDLKITFRTEQVIGPGSVRVKETPMPLVLSPLHSRQKGGGYVLVTDSPDHIKELCRQAARSLDEWIGRYEAALAYAKANRYDLERVVGKLDDAAIRKAS